MNKLPMCVIWGVATSVYLVFLGSLCVSVYYSIGVDPPSPGSVPPVATYVVSAVNGILAANLGAIFGVTAVRGFRATVSAPERLQWIAAAVYIATVVTVITLWGFAGFSEDSSQIAPAIPEVARTGIGVLFAAFAASLGVQAVWAGQKQRYTFRARTTLWRR